MVFPSTLKSSRVVIEPFTSNVEFAGIADPSPMTVAPVPEFILNVGAATGPKLKSPIVVKSWLTTKSWKLTAPLTFKL